MLQALFLTVLEISIASSAVILIWLLLSPLLCKRYGSKLHWLVWLVLAVRLLIPFNMPLQNAIHINLFATTGAQVSQYGWFLPNPAQVIEREQESQTQNTAAEQKPARYTPIRLTPIAMAATVWSAGMALFLLYHMGAYFYTLHRLRRWSTPIQDADILQRFQSIKKELSIQNKVRLYQSSKAASPLLMGFLHTRIVLPEQTLSPEQLDFMLRHELWHLKRRDLWYKLLMLLANAVHWFNPFVWLMDRQAGLDTELACDADVLREADGSGRRVYGYTILSFMEQGWRCKTPLTSRFYGGKTQMKQRFYNITDTSGKKRGTALFCAVALVIVLVGCTVHAAAPEPAAPTAPYTAVPMDEMVNAYDQVEIERPASTATDTPASGVADSTSLVYTPETEPYAEALASEEIDRWIDQIDWSQDPYSGGDMAWPLPGYHTVTSGAGPRFGGTDFHTGIDISGKDIYGAPIIAANDGTVARVSKQYTSGVGYGMYVLLDHGGEMSTLYAQCSEILVAEGDRVAKGEKIALVGSTGYSTGPHLHFEVRENGSWKDPMPYISSPGFIWPTVGGYISAGLDGYPGHTGLDIAVINGTGTPIYAAADGIVTKAVNSNVGYGRHIVIDHGNGYSTLYGMNNKLLVEVGDTVTQGQTIAEMGRTGNATGVHLHFEIRYNGEFLDPADFIENGETGSALRDTLQQSASNPDTIE